MRNLLTIDAWLPGERPEIHFIGAQKVGDGWVRYFTDGHFSDQWTIGPPFQRAGLRVRVVRPPLEIEIESVDPYRYPSATSTVVRLMWTESADWSHQSEVSSLVAAEELGIAVRVSEVDRFPVT